MKIPTLMVLSGVPRSGKSLVSAFLAEQHGFLHVCADNLRMEYGMQWGRPDNREMVVNHVVHYRALEGLMMQKDVVIDCTGMFYKQRAIFFDLDVYSLGKLFSVNARKVLVSLDITPEIWEQRTLEAGRSTEQKEFFLDKFHPVSPQESQAVHAHLRYSNNSPADLQFIKQSLSQFINGGQEPAQAD